MDAPKVSTIKKVKQSPVSNYVVNKKVSPPRKADISGDVHLSPATSKKHHLKKKKLDTSTVADKYPIFKNQQLIQQFMSVPMTNNQKGRIRQTIRDSLVGTANVLIPSIINGKIHDIIASSEHLSEAQLRRIRILYNLLKTAIVNFDHNVELKKKVVKNPVKSTDTTSPAAKVPAVPKKKRFVVFLGNLPLDVNKEKILDHFKEMNEHIISIRIPKIKEGKKSAIAYMELSNEPSYEFALSKHHSMMKKRRINVLYTANKTGKISKNKVKSKSAKLIALGKEGRLMGSVPLARKRSQRRAKQKLANLKAPQM